MFHVDVKLLVVVPVRRHPCVDDSPSYLDSVDYDGAGQTLGAEGSRPHRLTPDSSLVLADLRPPGRGPRLTPRSAPDTERQRDPVGSRRA